MGGGWDALPLEAPVWPFEPFELELPFQPFAALS